MRYAIYLRSISVSLVDDLVCPSPIPTCSALIIPQTQNKITLLASTVKVPASAPQIRSWYAEREAAVSLIRDRLGVSSSDGEDDFSGQPLPVGITGPSGAGKSIVASMVVAREDVRAHFRKGVLWLTVGQEARHRIPSLMNRLANMVFEVMAAGETRRPRTPDVGVDPEDGAAYIREVVGEDRSPFLVIADDVWDIEVLKELKSTGATVLYTTRDEHLFDDSPLRIHELLNGEVAVALRRAAELDEDVEPPDASAEIILRCASMAMDLAFVGRWSSVRGTTGGLAWASALVRILEAQKTGEEGGVSVPWRAAVLRAGLDELVLDNEQHRDLYLALAVIPKGLAFSQECVESLLYDERCPPETVRAAKGIVATFEEWSILTREEGGKYRVHDAHLDFARDLTREHPVARNLILTRWRKRVATADALFAWPLEELVEIWRAIAGCGGGGVDYARLYVAVLDAIDPSDAKYAVYLRRIAFFLWLAGDRDEACDLWTKLLTIEQNHGVDAAVVPNQDITLVNVGVHLWSARRTEEAGRCFRRALSIQEELLGDDHLDVADTLHRLAWCLFTVGRIDEAEPLHRRALAIRKDKLGAEHLDVARTLNALGLCVSRVQRVEDAEWFHHRALDIYEDKLGADHPKVAQTLYDLGRCTSAAERLGEAETFYRRALSIQEHRLGVDSLPVANTLYALAGCLSKAGKPEEVDGMYRRILAIRKNSAGRDDPVVARAAYALGQRLLEAGRTEEATPLLHRALASTKEFVGGNHPAVADTLHSLGACALSEGRLEQANEFFGQCLATREAELDAFHPSVAYTLYDLGRCASMMDCMEEAEGFYRRALVIQEKNLGADNLDVATILYLLGSCAAEKGRLGEAERLYRRALKSRESALGTDHIDVADVVYGLGRCAYETGRWKEATRFHSKALLIYEKELGPKHARVAHVLHELGKSLLEAGRIKKAETLFRRELGIVTKEFGASHPSSAHAYDCLAQCAFELGRVKDAEELYRLVLAIWEKRLGADHMKVVAALHSLGLCVYKDGRWEEAKHLYSRALSIGEGILGEDHPDLAATSRGLQRCDRQTYCCDSALLKIAPTVVVVAESSAVPVRLKGHDFLLEKRLAGRESFGIGISG